MSAIIIDKYHFFLIDVYRFRYIQM